MQTEESDYESIKNEHFPKIKFSGLFKGNISGGLNFERSNFKTSPTLKAVPCPYSSSCRIFFSTEVHFPVTMMHVVTSHLKIKHGWHFKENGEVESFDLPENMDKGEVYLDENIMCLVPTNHETLTLQPCNNLLIACAEKNHNKTARAETILSNGLKRDSNTIYKCLIEAAKELEKYCDMSDPTFLCGYQKQLKTPQNEIQPVCNKFILNCTTHRRNGDLPYDEKIKNITKRLKTFFIHQLDSEFILLRTIPVVKKEVFQQCFTFKCIESAFDKDATDDLIIKPAITGCIERFIEEDSRSYPLFEDNKISHSKPIIKKEDLLSEKERNRSVKLESEKYNKEISLIEDTRTSDNNPILDENTDKLLVESVRIKYIEPVTTGNENDFLSEDARIEHTHSKHVVEKDKNGSVIENSGIKCSQPVTKGNAINDSLSEDIGQTKKSINPVDPTEPKDIPQYKKCYVRTTDLSKDFEFFVYKNGGFVKWKNNLRFFEVDYYARDLPPDSSVLQTKVEFFFDRNDNLINDPDIEEKGNIDTWKLRRAVFKDTDFKNVAPGSTGLDFICVYYKTGSSVEYFFDTIGLSREQALANLNIFGGRKYPTLLNKEILRKKCHESNRSFSKYSIPLSEGWGVRHGKEKLEPCDYNSNVAYSDDSYLKNLICPDFPKTKNFTGAEKQRESEDS